MTLKRWRVRLVWLPAFALLALAGCDDKSAKQASRTDLRVTQAAVVLALDPSKNTSVPAGGVLNHVFERLTQVSADGQLEPLLALSWTPAADGLSWNFQLRQGVVFHDGAPFNADAVVMNIQRLIDPKNRVPLVGNIGPITGAKAIDANTVQISTKTPFSGLPIALSHAVAGMVSPRAITAWGEDLGNHPPAGTGPFKVTSFHLPDEVVMERNDAYWGTKPKLTKVTFRPVVDDQTRLASLLSNEVDLDFSVSPEARARAAATDGIELHSIPSIRLFMVDLPFGLPALQDIRVRQALNDAIDRDQIVQTVMQGDGEPADSSISPRVNGSRSFGKLVYDPARARKELAEAGWTPGPDGVLMKDGAPFPLLHLEASRGYFPKDAEIAQAVTGYLKQIGVPVELQLDEYGVYFPLITRDARQKNWAVQIAWGYPTMDGATFLCQVYSRGHRYNFGGYDSDRLESDCATIQATFDLAKRATLIGDAAGRVFADLPSIYLVVPKLVSAQRRGLKDVMLSAADSPSVASAYWTAP